MYVSFYADFPPTNVIIASLTSHSVTITWKPTSSPRVIGYINYYISYATKATYANGGSMRVKGTKAIITNLEENTEYDITVYAIISGKMSFKNPKVTIITYSDGKLFTILSYQLINFNVYCSRVQFLVHHQGMSQQCM